MRHFTSTLAGYPTGFVSAVAAPSQLWSPVPQCAPIARNTSRTAPARSRPLRQASHPLALGAPHLYLTAGGRQGLAKASAERPAPLPRLGGSGKGRRRVRGCPLRDPVWQAGENRRPPCAPMRSRGIEPRFLPWRGSGLPLAELRAPGGPVQPADVRPLRDLRRSARSAQRTVFQPWAR